MYLRHADLWRAIDDLARDHGYTISALARRAGLDPSAFNKSKRGSPDGRLRWPSLESLAKILDVTGVTPLEFFGFSAPTGADSARGQLRLLPTMGQREASEREPFDADGFPVGKHWDPLPFPELADRQAYGVTIAGDAAEPVYRDGDIVIASPRAALKRGDRALVRTISGRMIACAFIRRTAGKLEIRPFGAAPETHDTRGIAFAHRIVWASQ
ncbi:MAG: helix-turn-helix transcriptional regulator [Azospirillum sp.]|nr:helix-turn-helix transcriptional regulator [Azospirillum sp.]MCZ8125025.1 helix-turn-helix transcriptional regulator [Magnetospirillum sp.]